MEYDDNKHPLEKLCEKEFKVMKKSQLEMMKMLKKETNSIESLTDSQLNMMDMMVEMNTRLKELQTKFTEVEEQISKKSLWGQKGVQRKNKRPELEKVEDQDLSNIESNLAKSKKVLKQKLKKIEKVSWFELIFNV